MAEQSDGTTPAAAKTESHDPDFPEAFLQFMRSGWREDPIAVAPLPEVPTMQEDTGLLVSGRLPQTRVSWLAPEPWVPGEQVVTSYGPTGGGVVQVTVSPPLVELAVCAEQDAALAT